LPPNANWGIIDILAPTLAGNWMVRGSGTTVESVDYVPWLAEDPISGTIPAMTGQTVELTFDAGVPEITQPGDYHAELEIVHDTPYPVANLPVTLTVTPPSTVGELVGTVYSLGHCDVNTATLAGAEVLAEDGATISVTTDVSGTYHMWLEAGAYTVTFSAADHVSDIETVTIVSGTVYTQDAYLRSAEPCISIDPLSMEATLLSGQSEVQILSLINAGAGAGTFEIGITALLGEGFEDGIMPPAGGWSVTNTHSVRNWTITSNPDFVHSGTYAGWVNYDTPEASDEWLLTPILDLTGITTLNLDFWAISDTDWCPSGGAGANMLLHVTDAGGTPIATVWDMCGDEDWAGDFEYRFVSLGLSAYAGQTIRLAWQYVGIDGQSFGLDDVLLSGTVVVPWLSEDPISGTVSADSTFMVDVTFTALPTMMTGTYTTTIFVNTDDAVNDQFDVPATLNIMECVEVSGADFDFMPADPLVDETVTFTATVDPGTATIPLSYTWDFGDGSPIEVMYTSGITHAFSTADTYTVTLTIANVCPSEQMVEKTITVETDMFYVYLPVVLKDFP
jgi:PKD repeat protein